MNHHPHYQRLLELSWRRKLTSSEEAELRTWLATHPELQGDWELEAALNEALVRLPDAPVASNFTTLVLQSVEKEEEARTRTFGWHSWHWRPVWLPRVAFAGVLVAAGMLSYQAIRQQTVWAAARGLEAVSDVRALPSPQALRDFEIIRALSPARGADQELLALLQ